MSYSGAMAFTPVTMVKDGNTAVAYSAGDYSQLQWDGYVVQGTPPDIVDPVASAVASRILDKTSAVYAALLQMVITRDDLVIAPTPPASLPAGTVYINNSRT